MAGWLGKGRGTVARLAAVLALLDWTANRPGNAPPPTVITTQHLCAAWDLWERYYRPHAQAVFDRAGPADGDRQGKHKARQHARRVIGWIRARGVKEISREEVRREALSQRVNAAGADEVILALEQAGVLREVEVDEEDYPSPGRPARRWQVNPALARKTGCANCGKSQPPQRSWGGVVVRRRRRGRKPRVESLRRIACANCGKANRSRLEGRRKCRLAKMIKRLGARTSSGRVTPTESAHVIVSTTKMRTWRSALRPESRHRWGRATPVARLLIGARASRPLMNPSGRDARAPMSMRRRAIGVARPQRRCGNCGKWSVVKRLRTGLGFSISSTASAASTSAADQSRSPARIRLSTCVAADSASALRS